MGGGNEHTHASDRQSSKPGASSFESCRFSMLSVEARLPRTDLKDLLIGNTFSVSRGDASEVLFEIKFEPMGVLKALLADGSTVEEWWIPWIWSEQEGGSKGIVVLGGKTRPSMIVRFKSLDSFSELDMSAATAAVAPAVGSRLASHAGTTCAITHTSPICGVRYHLVGCCDQYNLCEIAYNHLLPFEQNLFERVESPSAADVLSTPHPFFGQRAVHHGITCDGTGESPLTGPRFHKWGQDYDLNETAFASLAPEEQAGFVRIDRPKPSTPTWPPPESGSVDSSSEAAAAPWPPSLSQRPPFQAPSNPFRFSLPAVPSPFATPSFPQPTPAPPTPLAIELVVDRSASMAPLLKGTVSGVNKFLANQWRAQAELDQRSGGCGGGGGEGGQVFRPPQQATVSLTTFDDTIEQVWNKVPLQRFYPFASNRLHLSPAMVRPRGRTALLDAIGSTLVKDGIGVCVIVTGGHENASRTFNRSEIVTLIEARKQEGWSFVFLAANQDAIATGRSLGIHERNACTFGGSAAGVAAGWASASDQIAQNRTQGTPLGFGFAQRQACAAGDPAALGVLHSRKNDGFAFGS